MPRHTRTTRLTPLAVRAAAVATTTTALALAAVLPASAEPVTAAVAPIARTGPLVGPSPLTTGLTAVTASTAAQVANAQSLITAPAAARTSALSKAMSKIGAPYVWGAAGPGSFDCSGLVLWSYKQVGVSLPHSSQAQSRMGTPVAKSDLRPGDLVFFYSPVSHVAIYIGNGKVVHASTSGQPVKVSDLKNMPFNSARRI